MRWRGADEVLLLDGLDRPERGGAGDRVAAVGAAEAAGVHRVHDLGAPRHGGERQPAGDALGGGDQVGDDALVLAGEHRAGAGEPGLHLVGDEHDALLGGVRGKAGQEALARAR